MNTRATHIGILTFLLVAVGCGESATDAPQDGAADILGDDAMYDAGRDHTDEGGDTDASADTGTDPHDDPSTDTASDTIPDDAGGEDGIGDPPEDGGPCEDVVMTDMGNYWSVVLDYGCGATRREMGRAYGDAVVALVPGFEADLDEAVADLSGSVGNYLGWIDEVEELGPDIPAELRDEIEGFASAFTGGTTDGFHDGSLSENEVYIINLIWEVSAISSCSGLGVFGIHSATGNAILYHIWESHGSFEWFNRNHQVTTVLNGARSVTCFGWLGYLGCFHGINDDGVFLGTTASPTGMPVTTVGAHVIPLDERWALESYSTIEDVAAYMADPSWHYVMNHNIILGDATRVRVLENNFSGTGSSMRRELRDEDSVLNPGVSWGYDDIVATVNSFMLQGNHDNHTMLPGNVGRWERFESELASATGPLDFDDVKDIATLGPGNHVSGEIFDQTVYQIVVIEPATGRLEIFFRQPGPVTVPAFDTVALAF